MSKWQIILMAGMAILVVFLGSSSFYLIHELGNLNQKLSDASNIISAKEAGIQNLNNKLGIAQSSLATKDELNKKYEGELSGLQDEFKDLTKKYKLDLESRDHTIAQLKGTLTGGNTTVVIKEPPASAPPGTQVISYSWQDTHQRFKLTDPDIFTKNDETFEYKQQVAITGYVYTDKTGEIKIRKLNLQEVTTDDSGKVTPIDGSNIEIVDNKFEYIKPDQNPKDLFDIWHPRVIVSFDTQLYPGVGVELVNLGRYLDYANIGLNTKVAINTLDGLKGIKSSTVGLGLAYNFVPPFLDTNIGLGLGFATPMDNFTGKYIITADAIFYLTN